VHKAGDGPVEEIVDGFVHRQRTGGADLVGSDVNSSRGRKWMICLEVLGYPHHPQG
jgi:hypothetical protein